MNELSAAQIAQLRKIIQEATDKSVQYGKDRALEGRGSSWTTPWPGYHKYHVDWTMEKVIKAIYGFVDIGGGI